MNKAGTENILTTAPSIVDNCKDWQMEMLMEKLRSKASQFKSLQETAKNVRMAMLDKRFSLDSVEKSQHQKCLDTLQHCIKVTSLQSMVERLESLTRQLGLKFMVGLSGVELFISSDMFYLEIILEQTGVVRDVKVHHEGKVEQQSCAELVACLARQDFADFTAQLEGFASIYQLNAEKKVKCKAFTALQSLESDLNTLAQLQTFMKEPFNLLHKSPVGILEKRRGGHPMKLTYFVSPYDLINKERGELEPITVENVISKSLGYNVTVCMEGSAAHKLQTTSLITVNRNLSGMSTPSYANLTNLNSSVIPACFVLRLNKPMPMCVSLIRQIQQLTELECAETTITHPLIGLIVSHSTNGKLDGKNNRGLFVTLPDQHHCYFISENKSMNGVLVQNVPFTHPGQVPQILVILRQQALFNTMIISCVRENSKQDFESMLMFEITALSSSHISIHLQHPIEETMATAELDLSDISNLQCCVPSVSTLFPPDTLDTTSEVATRILNRTISIPITMRAILKMWDKQVARKNHFNGHENFNLPLGSGDPGGHKSITGNGMPEFGSLDNGKGKQDLTGGHGANLPMMSHSHQNVFLNESMIASAANFPNFQATDPPMISNIELAHILAGTGPSDRSNKHVQKRRASEDLWKNAKRKHGEDSELMETSSNDSTSRSTPLSHEAQSEISIATPTSLMGFQSDLELSALDANELIGSSDKVLPEFDNIDELGDVEEMLAAANPPKEHKIRKIRDMQKSPSASSILELGEKTLVPPSVSITPINPPPGFNSMGNIPMPRSGIEIIPIATTPPTSLPSSITITPLSSSQVKSMEERSRDKKSNSKSRSDDKNRLEKKRKRKRDESPMGPPEKIPIKQDPLSKPVSVSIKPAESPPLTPGSAPTSPSSMMRKFNASPTPTKSFSVSGKLSPSMMKSGIKSSSSSSSHHSPKHSPANSTNSPKHNLGNISSPKSHGTSPKHPSTTGSSGKPSMSTLKSAANSPNHKSSSDSLKSKSSSKDGSKDKDKRSSLSVSNSNKVKSSSVKLKQLEVTTNTISELNAVSNLASDSLPSPTASSDLSKSNNPAQVRNRKGSLSAVIDKLKSAQHCDGATDLSNKTSTSRERSGQTTNKSVDGSKNLSKSSGETKNSEYMVKPSSDGIKLTINKTRTKDSSKSLLKSQSSSSGTGSPKTHTGLKPGVNSGPASKKPQQTNQKSNSSPNMSNASSNMTSFPNFKSSKNLNSKSSVSSKSLTKFSNSPKSSSVTDLSRNKDRPRLNKSNSDKSIFSSSRDRKSSPTQNKEDDIKLALSKMDPYSTAPLMAEGLIKQLDKKFQIPKLSARNSDDKKSNMNKTTSNSDIINNVNRSLENSKIYNEVSLPKYPLPLPTAKMFDGNVETKLRMNAVSGVSSSSPILQQHKELNNDYIDNLDLERKKDVPQNLTTNLLNKDDSYKHNFNMSAPKPYSCSSIVSDLSVKSVDLTSKFTCQSDIKKDVKNFSKDVNDVLLDFSSNKTDLKSGIGGSNKEIGASPLVQSTSYPPSSSVSVHIVKSPDPSPHSASPCITDDELMDEALVGLGCLYKNYFNIKTRANVTKKAITNISRGRASELHDIQIRTQSTS